GPVCRTLPFASFREVTPGEARETRAVSPLSAPPSGRPAVLAAGKEPRSLGTEPVAGVDCNKVSTTYTADQLGQLLAGIKPAGDVQTTIWVGRSDHLIRKVVLSGPLLEAAKVVQLEVELHGFNQPVAIATPSVSPTAAPPATPTPTASPG